MGTIPSKINGFTISYTAIGAVVLWSGIKGVSITAMFQDILKGQAPTAAENTEQIGEPTLTGSFSPASGSSPSSPGGTSGANPTAGTATDGTETQNGTTIYKYLRANGYTPIEAAGAIASIWGESTWNPESFGSDGCGLLGWTPPSTITKYGGTCAKAGIGNNTPAQDMASQLPAIIKFVQENGDQQYVTLMNGASTVADAAAIWAGGGGRGGVERPLVYASDVHQDGVILATQIANGIDPTANLKSGF